jgi:hypothetical protein
MSEFLAWYQYNVPTGEQSLAQPIPAEDLLNIDLAYGSDYLNDLYAEMKKAIDMATSASSPTSNSVETMLDHMQLAIELADYKSAFVFVDNWDDLPPATLQHLLSLLLAENLLIPLQERKIVFKVFIPMLNRRTLPHVQPTCEIERLHNDARHQLSLYSYP